MSRVCGQCGLKGGDKYKCASCKVFKYCSVACYKQHQEKSGCGSSTNTNRSANPENGTTTTTTTSTSTEATEKKDTPNAASTSIPYNPQPARIPKSDLPTVSTADLEALAHDPRILAAVSSLELQMILKRIDGQSVQNGSSDGDASNGGLSDESRIAMLEKYRRTNTDFEEFIQHVLGVINRE